MTRLATVLAGAMTEAWSYGGAKVSPAWRLEQAQTLVAAIPPHIAANLEATCSLCVVCGMQEPPHERFAHPYQPLVPLGAPS